VSFPIWDFQLLIASSIQASVPEDKLDNISRKLGIVEALQKDWPEVKDLRQRIAD
jgi:hypothetical protein